MVEIIFIRLAAPEFHIRNFEIAPEVTRGVPVRLEVVIRPPLVIRQPVHRIVRVDVLLVSGQELDRLRPQRGDGLRRVVQVDSEAIGLVTRLHEAEDVIVDIAEEMHFRLDAPVVPCVGESRVLVENTGVPATHLVVGHHVAVLYILLLEDLRTFLEKVFVDPARRLPVFCRNHLIVALRLRGSRGLALELFGKRLVVEKSPWVIELAVPSTFEISH